MPKKLRIDKQIEKEEEEYNFRRGMAALPVADSKFEPKESSARMRASVSNPSQMAIDSILEKFDR
jgi:hypothetical protein